MGMKNNAFKRKARCCWMVAKIQRLLQALRHFKNPTLPHILKITCSALGLSSFFSWHSTMSQCCLLTVFVVIKTIVVYNVGALSGPTEGFGSPQIQSQVSVSLPLSAYAQLYRIIPETCLVQEVVSTGGTRYLRVSC